MLLTLLSTFVGVILMLCVLVVLMAALRPSISGSFVRNFRNKDAKSDEEMQEHIKAINWKRGFFRLMLVLSVLSGILAGMVNGMVNGEFYDSAGAFWAGFFMSFGLVWLIYFAAGFVIRGFVSKK